MHYFVCGMVYIKKTLLLIGKSILWSGGNMFPLFITCLILNHTSDTIYLEEKKIYWLCY